MRGRVTCAALVLLFLGTLVSESTNSKKCFSGGRGGRGRCYCVSFTLLCVIRQDHPGECAQPCTEWWMIEMVVLKGSRVTYERGGLMHPKSKTMYIP